MSGAKKAAIVGGGVIGGGWAARFLLNGWDVAVYDPGPNAKDVIEKMADHARRSLPCLYEKAMPAEGKLSFANSLEEAVAEADWVQESVPENLAIKHKVLPAVIAAAPKTAVIGSSTSGFMPSELNQVGDRIIVAHPFNPVYLLPLVELVGANTENAAEILRSIGMYPLLVRKEIDAHIADRLLEAVWRESLWLVKDGVATTEEIDEAIRMGFGLRWAQMGLFETYRIAGGEAGMKHFMAQFGPALSWPWTKLMDVPEFTDELVDLIAGQSDAQSGHMSIKQLEQLRDDNLVAMMRALRRTGSGAGGVITEHEKSFPAPAEQDLPVTLARRIPADWTDYNGHMNETHYSELASLASDGFLELIGADATYVKDGYSYFTVENHVRFLNELHAGQDVSVTTRLVSAEGKKLHLFHTIVGADGSEAATVETLLLHMDMTTRRSSPPLPHIAETLTEIAARHAALPPVHGIGRYVGQKNT